VVRELSDEEIAGLKETASHYVKNAARYLASLQS
jgi:carbonic anhydrase/acetyltransferase-like protein (isoleucine patch superfamily)